MIFILIPVHNRIQATLECLKCINNQTYKNFNIIIIDDGSTDNTKSIIKEKYPDVTILKGDGNLWWTGAMYKGVKYILERAKNDDFILSINNDVIFDKNYLEILYNTSLKHKRALVGSICKDLKDKKTVLDSGININWKKYSYFQTQYNESLDTTTQIDTISGRGVLIPIEVFKKIGNYLKNKLPHYIADYEFGFRAKTAGFPLVMSYKAIVYSEKEFTGFRPQKKILSFKEYWKKLFYIKSSSNILNHIHIVYLHCPKTSLKIFNIFYIIFGNFYLLLKNIILYSLLKLNFIKTNE
ncbi:MAG: glycosyltransferase family 2 protein [Patescibacteria group bacterium]